MRIRDTYDFINMTKKNTQYEHIRMDFLWLFIYFYSVRFQFLIKYTAWPSDSIYANVTLLFVRSVAVVVVAFAVSQSSLQ